ncbi:MAG: hypothetical protein AAF730_19420 [Bacteroidota bacterium]
MQTRTPASAPDRVDLDDLRSRFDFQAQLLSAYLGDALPQHTTRQAQILLDNLVRTGRETLKQVA